MFGKGAQVGKTSLLEVEFILRRKRRRWAYSFLFVTLQALRFYQNPRSLEEDELFFQQVFENLKLNKFVKEERRLDV